MDCDAFYASVEKRDNPELADKPVIIGGGRRGVVSTACYVARIRGVRSAMPMFQALKLCPDAVVIKPRMQVYVEVSRQIRTMMEELTPASNRCPWPKPSWPSAAPPRSPVPRPR